MPATFDVGRAIQMYRNGAPMKEIGAAFGVGETALYPHLRRRGIKRNRREPSPLDEYIRERCMPEPNTGCWLWLNRPNHSGYGRATFYSDGEKRRELAHRASYMAFVGDIPDGMQVLHRCDTQACVNPDHLFLGTQADNVADMKRKDRHCRGERHPDATLTRADAVAILRARGSETKPQLAAKFGVSQGTIKDIWNGRRWTHLEVKR